MIYRQDIQILRGVAVLLVVLFHLGLPGLERGFLGVDVFFVISGFLMAVIYTSNDWKNFYRRRAARLLPAYYATIFLTLIVSAVVTLPSENDQVINQGLFAAGFTSNIGYWMQNSYFSKADFNPLLHLWSLGVEIQFYLIVPILFPLLRRFPWLLPIAIAGSLGACLLLTTISPKTSFFMMPFRVWEFLIGYGVAHHFSSNSQPKFARPWIGLTCLVGLLGLMAFPVEGQALSPVIGHPGLGAVAACVFTGGAIAFGLPAMGPLGSLLTQFGKYSYSIYLVHFPIVVLGLYQPFSGTILMPPTLMVALGLAVTIALASLAMFHFFERRSWLGGFRGAIIATVVILAAAPASSWANKGRLSEAERNIFSAFSDRSEYRCGKLIRVLQPTALLCELTSDLPDDAPAVVLVGDSHSDSIKESMRRTAERNGYRLFFVVSNAALIPSPNGAELARAIGEVGAQAVMVHYSRRLNPERDLPSLIDALDDVPVVMLLPVPTYDQNVPSALWHQQSPTQTLDQHDAKIKSFADYAGQAGLPVYSLAGVLCTPICRLEDEQHRPYYFDDGHLTLTGARQLESLFDQVFRDLGKGIPSGPGTPSVGPEGLEPPTRPL